MEEYERLKALLFDVFRVSSLAARALAQEYRRAMASFGRELAQETVAAY